MRERTRQQRLINVPKAVVRGLGVIAATDIWLPHVTILKGTRGEIVRRVDPHTVVVRFDLSQEASVNVWICNPADIGGRAV